MSTDMPAVDGAGASGCKHHNQDKSRTQQSQGPQGPLQSSDSEPVAKLDSRRANSSVAAAMMFYLSWSSSARDRQRIYESMMVPS